MSKRDQEVPNVSVSPVDGADEPLTNPRFEGGALAGKATPATWAEKKGMANRFVESGPFSPANPLYQDFAMARAHAGWADDTQVTEGEFDAAIEAAKNHEFR